MSMLSPEYALPTAVVKAARVGPSLGNDERRVHRLLHDGNTY